MSEFVAFDIVLYDPCGGSSPVKRLETVICPNVDCSILKEIVEEFNAVNDSPFCIGVINSKWRFTIPGNCDLAINRGSKVACK